MLRLIVGTRFSSSSIYSFLQEANENFGSAALSMIFRLLNMVVVCSCVFKPKTSKALRLNLFSLPRHISALVRNIEFRCNRYSPLARYGLQKFVIVWSQRLRLHNASVEEHRREEGVEIEHEIRYAWHYTAFLSHAAEYLSKQSAYYLDTIWKT